MQIDAGLQQVGGEAVTKGMTACGFSEVGLPFRAFEGRLDDGDWHVLKSIGVPRKEPVLGPVLFPVLPKRFQGHLRQQGVAVLVPFTLVHADQHAGAVDVRDFKLRRLACPKSGRIGHHQHRFLFERGRGVEKPLNIVLAENVRIVLVVLGYGILSITQPLPSVVS